MDIDITRHLGKGQRDVSVREIDGREARVITLTRIFDGDIDDVWDAVTNAERLPRWFMPVTGELRLGGRFQLEGNASGDITKCEPPRTLSVTWEWGGDVSWVDVGLTAITEDSTQLVLEHVSHVPPEFWDQFGPGAAGVGWDLGFVGLGEHLAGAPAIDPEVAPLWPTTEAGRRFVAHCSEGWGRASIASGTDVAAAEAAAARTVAFYTGQDVAPDSD
ncbi:MAG: SRPBCC family protein [Deltaproteobacteria bacterium]|nr:SRPBCC family protein [Deltaproteobacteria bacterium]